MPTKTVAAPQLIFDKSRPGRIGANVPICDTPPVDLNAVLGGTRTELNLPEDKKTRLFNQIPKK